MNYLPQVFSVQQNIVLMRFAFGMNNGALRSHFLVVWTCLVNKLSIDGNVDVFINLAASFLGLVLHIQAEFLELDRSWCIRVKLKDKLDHEEVLAGNSITLRIDRTLEHLELALG